MMIIILFISYFERGISPYLKNGHKIRRMEVFFPGVFTSKYPYEPRADIHQDKHFVMPISRLSHITHDKEAVDINGYMNPITNTPDPNFRFIATKKVGKDYEWDGSPIGESFRYSSSSRNPPNSPYMFIKPGQSFMPEGYYSWWGVQFDPNYELASPNPCPSDISPMLFNFESYRSSDYRCPHYLRNPPSSPYGNNEFSGELTDILTYYRDSRKIYSVCPETDQPLPDTYMLPGGTLRYQHEICYVIIVCTQEDLFQVQSQIAASDICSEPVVNLNGLVDENYKIIDYGGSKIPQLSFHFISTKESWENLAFAFYFPEKKQLSCPKDVLHHRSDINHAYRQCVKKGQGQIHQVHGFAPIRYNLN